MKIAHLIPTFFPSAGGAEICTHNVATCQAAMGHDVTVITHAKDKNGLGKKPFAYKKITVPRPPLYWNFFFARAYIELFLAFLQDKYRFDVWQVTMGYPLGAGSVAFFNRRRIPCVLRCCGDDIQTDAALGYGVRLKPRIDRVVRGTYPGFNAFIANSQSMLSEYRKLGIGAEKIFLIPNGVDCQRFSSSKREESFRAVRGIAKTSKIILSVGRNHPKKGYDLIPQILKRLQSDKNNDFVWIVVGKGAGALKPLAEQYGVADKFMPVEGIWSSASANYEFPASELIAYYVNADLFVLPTYIEGYPTVVLEALAAGIPVVTSDVPGCRDIIRNNENGILAPAGDVEAFVLAIENVISDNELRQTLCRNGMMDAQRLDWSRVAGQYAGVYEHVIKNRHGSSFTPLRGRS
ncbi:MAG: glycosyltransferase family 4 protein [Deltaproteobacteria bacterium]|nr:glycosyltransferase family 4 protein [Deltaproteobacteria bacterium]